MKRAMKLSELLAENKPFQTLSPDIRPGNRVMVGRRSMVIREVSWAEDRIVLED